MIIEKLSDCKNASRFGTCTECGEPQSDLHNLYRLKFNSVSVCLCENCYKQTLSQMDIPVDIEKAYARGYNNAMRKISLSGEYERAFQRGYDKAIKEREEVDAGDCVSRQAVFDILEDNRDGWTIDNVDIVFDKIESLPSVSPLTRDYMTEAGAFELPQEEVEKLMDVLTSEDEEADAGDCISRQAAIDALREAENHAFNSFYKGLVKAHKIIADLPSVHRNGTPLLDNATNRDMIKALFPDIRDREHCFAINLDVNKQKIGEISLDWWNAPYKAGGEG